MVVSAKQIAELLASRFKKQFETRGGVFAMRGVYVDGPNWDPDDQKYWTKIHSWGEPQWIVVVHVYRKKLDVQIHQSPGVPDDVMNFITSSMGPDGYEL